MVRGIRFYIDPQTGMPHIYRHRVADREVAEVLERSGEDRAGYDGARVAIGQTRAGRYLKVIYVIDSQKDRLFVITAYELRRKSLTAYKRRRRRKGSR